MLLFARFTVEDHHSTSIAIQRIDVNPIIQNLAPLDLWQFDTRITKQRPLGHHPPPPRAAKLNRTTGQGFLLSQAWTWIDSRTAARKCERGTQSNKAQDGRTMENRPAHSPARPCSSRTGALRKRTASIQRTRVFSATRCLFRDRAPIAHAERRRHAATKAIQLRHACPFRQ